jgi:hypothetical protein
VCYKVVTRVLPIGAEEVLRMPHLCGAGVGGGVILLETDGRRRINNAYYGVKEKAGV